MNALAINPAWYHFDGLNLIAITLMAVTTFLCRAGGYLLFRRVTPGQLTRAILAYVPGTLFVSFVLPAMLQGGLQSAIGTLATVAAMVATRNISIGIGAGVFAAWAVYLLK